jgi:hypothetical protein
MVVHSNTKVDKNNIKLQHISDEIAVSPENDTSLDKCKHLDTTVSNYIDNEDITKVKTTLKNDVLKFKKLAYKKTYSYLLNDAYLDYLLNQKNRKYDFLIKQVSEAIECKNVYLQQGFEYFTHTCKRKTCLSCQNKRTAELIDSYLNQLDFDKKDIYFGTATKSATSKSLLQKNVNDTINAFSVIVRNIKKTYGLEVQAIRTLECTHNILKDTYHLHVHYLIKGQKQAELFRQLWFNHWNKKSGYTIDKKAQHLTVANKNSGLELFKYCTKIEDKVSFEALSNILYVFQNRRLVQAYGMTKETVVNEETEKTVNVSNGYKTEVYKYDIEDFNYNSATDRMTKFVPSKIDLKIFQKLKDKKYAYHTTD